MVACLALDDTVLEISAVYDSPAYRAICDFYGTKVAKRSRVPLINHIQEGITILQHIGADLTTAEAYCAHPLLQNDDDLELNWSVMSKVLEPDVMLLVMEYRNIANRFLSDKVYMQEVELNGRVVKQCKASRKIKLSPLSQVNNMLIADKVQNYKDFVTYHSETHKRREELEYYFKLWHEALGVTPTMYRELKELLS